MYNAKNIAFQNCITALPFNKKNITVSLQRRRRMELEDKAKVVASDWGTESLPRSLFCLGLF